jgi:hydrogenase/urease accessory protein HupE
MNGSQLIGASEKSAFLSMRPRRFSKHAIQSKAFLGDLGLFPNLILDHVIFIVFVGVYAAVRTNKRVAFIVIYAIFTHLSGSFDERFFLVLKYFNQTLFLALLRREL